MHEMTIAASILDIIKETASNYNFKQIKEVRLEIGVLSGVEIESLTFCLDVILKDSIAAKAKIIWERPLGRGRCLKCDEIVPIESFYDSCNQCGNYSLQIISGNEMRVKDLLIE